MGYNIEEFIPVLPSRELISEFIEELYKESRGDCVTILDTISKLLEGELEDSLRNLNKYFGDGEIHPEAALNILILKSFKDFLRLYSDLIRSAKDGNLDPETKSEVVNVLEPLIAVIRLAGSWNAIASREVRGNLQREIKEPS
ncbi:hypothetical protein EYM_05705 [Ignicoccus islandicus DSM 13165]|uniref:Uncharacterized protein n=1 Tax=Ignicoccus islandicus DSM 13165 TaxID=940295 RepID=A0A0U3F4X0_9CREN|nr:hypothetical protein [Ignicoccus islandicus]ALU12613.1 hypothetical protein EYM_05705 [Ignicoccus islandicus DSM 13165]